MFIVYLNDLASVLHHAKYKLYAADTVINILSGDLNEITDTFCFDLSSFKKWCDRNRLTLNVLKTKYVTFGLKSQTKKVNNHVVHIDKSAN